MFARLRFPVFIDSVVFEFTEPADASLQAVLKDESGSVCSSLEAPISTNTNTYYWRGLNDLPYGVYTIEFKHGDYEQIQRLVKRV